MCLGCSVTSLQLEVTKDLIELQRLVNWDFSETWNSWPVDMTLMAMLWLAAKMTDFEMSDSFLAKTTK